MSSESSLAGRIASSELSVAIIGLGYVGLPTAIGFLDAGFKVWGVDISERTIECLTRGENPTGDPDLDDIIPDIANPNWNITTDTAQAVSQSHVVLVTVPTPVTHDLKPDLSYIENAGRAVFESIERGSNTIVVLESTVYPGVTAETWLPLIEELGLEVGIDVTIAYCPERFNPGDAARGVRQVARVIGCADEEVGADLVQFYAKLTSEDVRYVGKIEVAEASKLIENVQRDVNIALVNELARIFPEIGVDVEDVLAAAATKWNFHRYTPGVGVGGHCIPVDPYYMIQRARQVGVPAELITAGRAVNRSMPNHVAGVIYDLIYQAGIPAGEGRVLLLGWSYKPEVGDPRETPAEPLSKALQDKDLSVAAFDPHIGPEHYPEGIEVVDSIESAEGFDIAILVTAHRSSIELDWADLAGRMRNPIIYDGRRVLDLEKLSELGWQTHAVGRP